LEADKSDNGKSSYCWWWCYNNGFEGTSPPSLPQMNLYGLRLLTESATNSKYLRLCTHGSVSPNSYTSFVECSALCWKNFRWKKELLQVAPLTDIIYIVYLLFINYLVLFICGLFNDNESNSAKIKRARMIGLLMNNALESMWKKNVVA
jgi:hypothetical protein